MIIANYLLFVFGWYLPTYHASGCNKNGQILNCSHKNLTDCPLFDKTMEGLNMDFNLLSNLSTVNCIAWMKSKVLWVRHNKLIGTVNLTNDVNLNSIYLDGNNVSSFWIGSQSIIVLEASNNGANEIHININTNSLMLTKLILANNVIEQKIMNLFVLQLQRSGKIEWLDISGNGLSELPPNPWMSFQPATLKMLNLSHNELKVFFIGSYKMNNFILDLSHNKIDNLYHQSSSQCSVVHLDVSYNSIGTLPNIILSCLKELETLRIAGNPIDCSCSSESEPFLQWLRQHKEIIVDAGNVYCADNRTSPFSVVCNKTTTIFSSTFYSTKSTKPTASTTTHSLSTISASKHWPSTSNNSSSSDYEYRSGHILDCKRRNLIDCPRFDRNITHLILDNNKLTRFSTLECSKWTTPLVLSIRNNSLDGTLEITSASDWHELYLSHNMITKLQILSTSLHILDASYNKIFDIDLSSKSLSLRKLMLSHNSLKTASLNKLLKVLQKSENITFLDISFNNLRVPDPTIWLSFRPKTIYHVNLSWNSMETYAIVTPGNELYGLDLSNNKISQIISSDSCIFSFLNLSSNAIKTLDENVLSCMKITKSLDISNNPIDCSCSKESAQFIRWLWAMKSRIVNPSNVRCANNHSSVFEIVCAKRYLSSNSLTAKEVASISTIATINPTKPTVTFKFTTSKPADYQTNTTLSNPIIPSTNNSTSPSTAQNKKGESSKLWWIIYVVLVIIAFIAALLYFFLLWRRRGGYSRIETDHSI